MSGGKNYFLPGQSSGGIPGFVSESDRFQEEFFGVLFSKEPLGIAFTTEKALSEINVPQHKKINSGIKLIVKSKIKEKVLLNFLSESGYRSTEKVINPGYYSRRGGILDVFLINSRHPVRIELFGSSVESLRLYNPYSQLTIKTINSVYLLPGYINAPKGKAGLELFLKKSQHPWLQL